jgi:hypothetical protein
VYSDPMSDMAVVSDGHHTCVVSYAFQRMEWADLLKKKLGSSPKRRPDDGPPPSGDYQQQQFPVQTQSVSEECIVITTNQSGSVS